MYDAVQESFDLILDLQEGDMDLYSANENRSCCTTFSWKTNGSGSISIKVPPKLQNICGFGERRFIGKITEIIFYSTLKIFAEGCKNQ